jgi:hypothetical protein
MSRESNGRDDDAGWEEHPGGAAGDTPDFTEDELDAADAAWDSLTPAESDPDER